MENLNFSISKHVLLTGAGFTYNYGGFLANRMWSEIHNRYLKLSERLETNRLKTAIKKTFNYEDLYEDVLRSKDFSDKEKDLFFKSVLGAYEVLDDVIRDVRQELIGGDLLDLNKLKKFIEKFSGKPKERGFFFSLNQDLFIERYCYAGSIGPSLPGLKVNNQRFVSRATVPLKEIGYVRFLSDEDIDYQNIDIKTLSKLFYVKMHGSYDWRDSENQEILIIGTNKPARISAHPLLSWYFDLFKTVLSIPNAKLMVIGYGFKDKHINGLIANAVKNANLKIYILNPQDPESFLHNTLGFNEWASDTIWSAVDGYFQITPREIFSRKTKYDSLVKNLMNSFFE